MYNPRNAPPHLPPFLPPPPPSQLRQQILPPNEPAPDPLWQRRKLKDHLTSLTSLVRDVTLLKAIASEIEASQILQESFLGSGDGFPDGKVASVYGDSSCELSAEKYFSTSSSSLHELMLETLQKAGTWSSEYISLAFEAAKQLEKTISAQLGPLEGVLDGSVGNEKESTLAKLGIMRAKMIRNRKWRSRKRRRVSEALRKERERYEIADREADEWRTRQIAKLISKRKMEKMKEVAERKAKEEKLRLEKELEMVLIVDKLQDLRALRILKLKKQGKFFPEEDNKFMERVQAAVEEEERQAAAAANPSAAATAISNAEARKIAVVLSFSSNSMDLKKKFLEIQTESELPVQEMDSKQDPLADDANENTKSVTESNNSGRAVVEAPLSETGGGITETYKALPAEFYHYYYGSSVDMGTLIEVRRAWDAFIMPGGSRIPQHWVEAPQPSNPVWASYLVQQGRKKMRRLLVS